MVFCYFVVRLEKVESWLMMKPLSLQELWSWLKRLQKMPWLLYPKPSHLT